MLQKRGAVEVGKSHRIIGSRSAMTMHTPRVLTAAILPATTKGIPTGREQRLAALGGLPAAGELFWHERQIGIRHFQSVLRQQAMHLTPMMGLMIEHVGDKFPTRLGYLAPHRRRIPT